MIFCALRCWGIRATILVLLAGTVVIATSVRAEEAARAPVLAPLPFEIRARLLSEFNILQTGQTRIFSPEKELTEAEIYGPEQDKQLVNRNIIGLYWSGEYADVLLDIYTLHSILVHEPDALGLEAKVLFPVGYFLKGLRVGFFHDSAHNLDTGRYGKSGSDMTGFHLRYKALETPQGSLDFWSTPKIFKNVRHPYFITAKATEVPQTEIAPIRSAEGIDIEIRNGKYLITSAVEFRSRNQLGPLSSLRVKNRIAYRRFSNFSFGWVTEYLRNFDDEEKFGKDEWMSGPFFEFTFGSLGE